ncbi:putative Rad51/AAA domain containing protein [Leishmania naiffi]|uniref:Rad51/AAA domain containing protein n=1 Tax=Leishmania naiffi TaxID=5678 RepID=A0AAW3BYH7_9TRYP
MSTSEFYALHCVYGGLREVLPASLAAEQSITSRCGAVESAAAGAPPLIAASDAVGTVDPPSAAVPIRTYDADALPTNSEAHVVYHRMPDDSAFLVTPDAELCTRHHASLAQVWAWRTQLSQHQSPLFPRVSTSGTLSACGRCALEETADTTLEGGTFHLLHGLCNGCQSFLPLTLAGSGRHAHGRVPAAAVSSRHLSIPTGLRSLDVALLGGLRRGWVTELTGLPGTGKTTLAAAWCRCCLRHTRLCGVAHDCVWLQSGGAVEPSVLSIAHEETNATELPSLAAAVHVTSLSNLEDLQQLLYRWQGTSASTSPLSTVGLIVLDSITELVQRSFCNRDDDALERYEALATILRSLKRLAEEQHVAILVITKQRCPHSPTFRRPGISHTSCGAYEEDGNAGEEDSEAWGSEYGRRASGGAGVVGPHVCRSNSSAEDVGQLGRLFFHNVNVRLQLRTGVPCTGCRPSSRTPFNAGGLENSGDAMQLRWQLEVLKSPLCAPFAVALRLRAPSSLSCIDGLPSVPGPPLCVEEIEDEDESGGAVVPLAPNTQFEEDLALVSLDPWDYTEVPFFLCL